jgi:DnaJ-class molecular chaperone
MNFKDYYEILDVHRNASKEVIEKAYITLAKKYHPDINSGNTEEATNKMKEINEAYEILCNESKRNHYNIMYDVVKGSDKDYNTEKHSQHNKDKKLKNHRKSASWIFKIINDIK